MLCVVVVGKDKWQKNKIKQGVVVMKIFQY
jgi:hypothetical protein